VRLASRLGAAVALLGALPAPGHAVRSAYVEVLESSPGRALVTVRAPVPVSGLSLVALAPCTVTPGPGPGATQALRCPGTVAGARLRLEGLGPLVSEAVVWVRLADGASASTLLTPARPALTVASSSSWAWAVLRQYVGLGVAHIAAGFDHLLFLLGLVVVLRRVRAVLLAETAFTLSHSLSFSAAALGWVRVPAAAVEACIALSLVLLAVEGVRTLARGSQPAPPSALRGAGLALAFGLVHGLGFAGGLAEIGLPEGAIPAALLGFGAGVEVGQVCFLALALALFALARRAGSPVPERALALGATYAVGAVGFSWLLERLVTT
jgi:HupE / UreJ protein